jgi:hypothetical protein
MTDDNTDTTLAQRVDQLEDRLDEALGHQERVEALVRQFATGQISRRTFLTSIAAVGGGAYLLSGRARADPEWGNATGESGTEQTPLKYIYAKNAIHESIDTDLADIHSPTNFETPAGATVPVRILADPVSNYALGLQLADNDAANGGSGYSTGLGWFGSNGEEIGHLSADNTNEISWYTRSLGLSESAGGGDIPKRLNISAGNTTTLIEIVSNGSSRLQITAKNSSSQSMFSLVGPSGTGLTWRYQPDTDIVQWWDDRNNHLMQQYVRVDQSLDLQGTVRYNRREILNPTASDLKDGEQVWDLTNDRMLYRDGSGTVHYFNPDGTL